MPEDTDPHRTPNPVKARHCIPNVPLSLPLVLDDVDVAKDPNSTFNHPRHDDGDRKPDVEVDSPTFIIMAALFPAMDVIFPNLSPLLLSLFLLFLTTLYLFRSFLLLLLRQRLSPLRLLPGPPLTSYFMGNLIEMHDQENTDLIHTWSTAYGSAFTYRGFIGGCRLMLMDPKAIGYVLGRAYEYPKPDFVRDSLASMAVGYDGLLTTEGGQHRKQRKILTPAFSANQIKSLSPVFYHKAALLRDIWLADADGHVKQLDTKDGIDIADLPLEEWCRTDVLSWLGRATLDVIGIAGTYQLQYVRIYTDCLPL